MLESSGRQTVCVDDLCAMAARHDERLGRWAQEPLCVVACYDRAVRALFRRTSASLRDSTVLLNLRAAVSLESLMGRLGQLPVSQGPIETIEAIDPSWPAWFPAIDYNRCRNCKQCLNFCLFGVYAQTEQKTVAVVRPQSCKNGCPACARVCPDAAIIFPKYEKSPINGDAVDESAWRQSHAQSAQSFKHRLSGNVYDLLHRRNKSDAADKLESLGALKEQLDIPDHLFKDNLGPNKGDS